MAFVRKHCLAVAISPIQEWKGSLLKILVTAKKTYFQIALIQTAHAKVHIAEKHIRAVRSDLNINLFKRLIEATSFVISLNMTLPLELGGKISGIANLSIDAEIKNDWTNKNTTVGFIDND